MKYSTYNDNHYNATVTKDHNKLDIKVGNVENKKRIPGAIFEYGVKSVNGKYGDVVLDAQDVGAIPNTEIIPRYVVDDVEYIITSWIHDTVSGVDGIFLWYKDESGTDDAIFIPSITGLSQNNTNLLENVLQNFVSYNEVQNLTLTQKEIARRNIGVDFNPNTLAGDGLSSDGSKLNVNIGNGLELNNNNIQIEDEVIFNCGTSTSVISHYSGGM